MNGGAVMTGWTSGEKHLITAAAAVASSDRPWVLEFHDEYRVSLYERLGWTVSRHDPLGRDRLISCGAALERVLLAIRMLGWTPAMELRHDRERMDEVARIAVTGRREPSGVDLRRHDAITVRRGHREPFADRPVENGLRRELLGAHGVDRVRLRPVEPSEIEALARVLNHTALTHRAFQRDLAGWTTPDRLSREFLLLAETPDDGRLDHVRAGMAAELTWLAAVAAGLVGSVLTQPFQPHEVRTEIAAALTLEGNPQLLLRFGHPTRRDDHGHQ
ncbi:hypothetical protein [Actinophytocola sp.]|uniref:hypothetical protein n=1 Tax=Actinophytocola sp. TaxID=1872138 RepID=UPI002ED44FFA